MSRESEEFEFETSDGLVLRGAVWGEQGAGPGIPQATFVHGSGLTVESYRPAFRAVLPRIRIHALNGRGHGASDNPPAMKGWEAQLADLHSFVTKRLRPPVILSGHSFGALLSLWLASRFPKLVSGLLLLDPLVPWRRDETWPETGEGPERELIERTRTRRDTWADRGEAAAWLRDRGVYRDWASEPFDLFLDSGLAGGAAGGVELACPSWVEAETYAGRPGPVIFQWAERVGVPAVIVRGRDSIHTRGAEDLANAFSIGAVLTAKGGHTFPQEYPREAGEALGMALDILARSPRGEPPACE